MKNTNLKTTRNFILARLDFHDHESSLQILERRWQALLKQILHCEHDIDQMIFDDEYQMLIKARNEYQTWIDTHLSNSSATEVQVYRTH